MERVDRANKNVGHLEILEIILQMKRFNALKLCTPKIHRVSIVMWFIYNP